METPSANVAPDVPVIAVHAAKFHCDDAMSVALLRHLPWLQGARVVRTVDEKVLAAATVVCDVGGVYNHELRRYDHHQAGFAEVFCEKTKRVKMAATGLVWRHYGRDLIRLLHANLNEEQIALLHTKLYIDFFQALDAVDNGIDAYSHVLPPGTAPLFCSNTDLSSRVEFRNPQAWEVPAPSADARFMEGVEMCDREWLDALNFAVKAWLPGRAVVAEAMKVRETLAPNCRGQVMVMREFAPWKDHLFSIEEDGNLGECIMYVVTEDVARKQWSGIAVPKARGSFANRLPFPAPWRGLRDDALSTASGLPGCRFVHASGFLACHGTLDGIIEMCRRSLEQISPAPATPVGERRSTITMNE